MLYGRGTDVALACPIYCHIYIDSVATAQVSMLGYEGWDKIIAEGEIISNVQCALQSGEHQGLARMERAINNENRKGIGKSRRWSHAGVWFEEGVGGVHVTQPPAH